MQWTNLSEREKRAATANNLNTNLVSANTTKNNEENNSSSNNNNEGFKINSSNSIIM